MAENTTAHKDRLKEITDSIEQGIKDLFQSDKYMEIPAHHEPLSPLFPQ